MAWNSPPSVSVGQTYSATDYNTYVKDNLIDLAQPGLVFAVMGSSLSLASSASESYPTTARLTFSSLPLAKNVTVSGSKLTVGVGGVWEWSAGVGWPSTSSATGTSIRAIKMYANDSATSARATSPNMQDLAVITGFGGYQVSMSAGNWVDLRGWHNHGSNLTLQTDCWLCGKLIYRS